MRINYNMAALNIYMSQNKALERQSVSIERISSGSKVNNAKDDPSVIAQSERMRMQIRGLQMSGRNVQDGISMLQTAEGGLDGMTSMLQRIRELTIQAANGSNAGDDKQVIQNEIDQMLEGMDQVAKNTEFNGLKLLAEDKELEMPIGANAGDNIIIPQKNLTSQKLENKDGKKLSEIKSGGQYSVTKDNIKDTLDIIDSALSTITSVRGEYGALENRFESNFDNVHEISDIMEKADSSLRDSDIAEEMMNHAKDGILSEVGNAMLAQANKLPQDVLRILENIKTR